MKKNKQKSLFDRFRFYKYSGPIVFVPLILLIVTLFIYVYTQVDFYESWSCDTLQDYVMDVDIPTDIIPHGEMTISQHNKIHVLLQECQDNQRFSSPIEHLK